MSVPIEISHAAYEGCREELDRSANYPNYRKCWRPAEFILWGKFFPPEALGPRCYDHAMQYTRLDAHTVEQSAIFDLRPFNPINPYKEK